MQAMGPGEKFFQEQQMWAWPVAVSGVKNGLSGVLQPIREFKRGIMFGDILTLFRVLHILERRP